MNVLFVDDQRSVLDGIAAGVDFEELGVEAVFYATGAQRALELAEENHIDVAVTDIEMPGEDGIWLIRALKERYPEMLTVMLTSHADFEYAQESLRLGCFDYLVQPAPHEEIERVLRRALQFIYERGKRNRLYEVGRRMQSGEMELLDGVAMNLFSSKEENVQSSLELLTLLGYPVSAEKQARVLILSFEQFFLSDTPVDAEREVHKQISEALKQAELAYPVLSLTSLNHHRQFVLLLFSASQQIPEVPAENLYRFFDALCKAMPGNRIQCIAGDAMPFGALRAEYRRVRDICRGRSDDLGAMRMEYDPARDRDENSLPITGSGAHWRSLLAAGQYHILMTEFENCMDRIELLPANKAKALCDLHQRMTHMFFNYFYENKADTHELFRNQYSYDAYMGSYSDEASLREAMEYMMKQVRELSHGRAPQSDVNTAKRFISDNISEPITVKDVAEHVCLSAEYFTKLFKKETGQNIKEYITLTKVEAAKDMLARADIPVGMVALELGYNNFSHFSQVFKKYEHMSPSEYRSKATGNKTE